MRKKLKIAIFHLAFIYSGGGEKLVLEEAKGLKKLGHDVTIFTPVINRQKCFPDIIGKFKIKTFLPQLPFMVPEHESFQILLSCVLAPFYAHRLKRFDVILAANQPSPWIAWVIKMLYKIPYISYLAQPTRFLYPRKIDKKTGLAFSKKASVSLSAKLMHRSRRFIHWADKISIRDADAVLANGEYIRSVIEATYAIKVISCPAGAHPAKKNFDYESRLRGQIKIGTKLIKKPYFLITNRHFAQKRFEFAISVLATMLKDFPNLSLVISGGETEYTDQLKRLVKQLSLNGKVEFLGLVKEKDLMRLYSNTAVYLYTAPEEDFGMGIIEAMATGTPVVAWNNAGPAKIIINGKTGLLAAPFVISDFTSKIQRLLSEPSLAEKVGRAGYDEIANKFSYRNHLEVLERRLKDVDRLNEETSH